MSAGVREQEQQLAEEQTSLVVEYFQMQHLNQRLQLPDGPGFPNPEISLIE